jgi:DivIVA domain-containing protein
MTFAPDDIEIKEFVPTLRGYDRTEVRAFLRAVAEDVRRLEDRLAERVQTGAAPAAAQPAFDTATSTNLEDAIRSLTAAVQSLGRTGAGDLRAVHVPEVVPVAVAPVAVAVAPVAFADPAPLPTVAQARSQTVAPATTEAIAPAGKKPVERPAAVVPPTTVSQLPVSQLPVAAPVESPAPPAATSAASEQLRTSTWDGVERRSARRPWSGRGNGDSTGSTRSTESSGSAKSSAAPRRLRSDGNESLISKFLPKVLNHRPTSDDVTDVDVSGTELLEDERSDNSNVVQLMRAV